ncbi:MAG: hypothetical protein JSS96_02675 [Bacteroidetes bacterium]|nr:hypothetical protein [Bacteroidota bacterium]
MSLKTLIYPWLLTLFTTFSCKDVKEHTPNKVAKSNKNLGNYYWAERSSIGNDTIYFSRITTYSGDSVRQIDAYNSNYTEILEVNSSHKHYVHFRAVLMEGYDIQRFIRDTTILVGKAKIIVRKYYINKSKTTDAELYLYYSQRLGFFMRKSPDWLGRSIVHTDNDIQNNIIDSVVPKLGAW